MNMKLMLPVQNVPQVFTFLKNVIKVTVEIFNELLLLSTNFFFFAWDSKRNKNVSRRKFSEDVYDSVSSQTSLFPNTKHSLNSTVWEYMSLWADSCFI